MLIVRRAYPQHSVHSLNRVDAISDSHVFVRWLVRGYCDWRQEMTAIKSLHPIHAIPKLQMQMRVK